MFKTRRQPPFIESLRATDLFADCSDKELSRLMRFATVLDVPAGQVLTRQGATGSECFVVMKGATVVERNGVVGAPTQGELVGELSLLDRIPRTATVTTTAPSEVLVMSQRDFASLYQQNIADFVPRIDAIADTHRGALRAFTTQN